MSDAANIIGAVLQEVDAGRSAALCVVVATRGSTPQVPGAMACVTQTGRIIGTVGGGMTEADVVRQARQLLDSAREGHAAAGCDDRDAHASDRERSRVSGSGSARGGDLAAPDGVFAFGLEHDCSGDTGPICGGQMDVAITVLSDEDQVRPLRIALSELGAGRAAVFPVLIVTPTGPMVYGINVECAPKLVIAGAGHVGTALAAIAPPLGFHVSVVDDRSEFTNAQRLPPPIEPITGDIAETLRHWSIDASTYVVIVTRGHQCDQQALAAVIGSPAKYVGMIGSQRKIKLLFENLRQSGVPQEQIDRVHSPIGLDIKAVTPGEIAISIAAEMISIRRAEYRKAIEGPVPIGDHAV